MLINKNNIFARLWRHLTLKRKKQYFLTLALGLIATFAEMMSIGTMLPFLAVLTTPEQVYYHALAQPVVKFLGITEPKQLLLPLLGIFVTAVIISGAVRLLLAYTIMRFSHAVCADLSIDIYRRTLYQDYTVHIARNSSEIIAGITAKTSGIVNFLLVPIMTLICSVFLLLGIGSALMMINAIVATSALIGFGIIYWAIMQLTRNRIKQNSQCIANNSTQLIKSVQEGLGGIRDVLIDGSQEFYCQTYRRADIPLKLSQGNNRFIAQAPRYSIETLGMVLIAGLAYFMSQTGDLIDLIPVCGALALGSQRLLPALQQGYTAFITMRGEQQSSMDVLNLLSQPLPNYANILVKPIAFSREIQLNNISFRYRSDTPFILKNINLTIAKGMRIGVIGTTGNGKSTLLDIVMGLLSPTEGNLAIDGKKLTTPKEYRSWQAHIAHVPQNIYLSDSTIAENIAFGISKQDINFSQVEQAAKHAQLFNLIQQWADKYNTKVGEHGIQLSGGQRQRIGIARALYKKANVLVFDEATSALDNDTEAQVMNAIDDLDSQLTILIIAHRLTTLKNCDQIIEVSNRGIAIKAF
ncbi:MAG: ABC transporter ATP-binding protein [Methylococcales symbiont of Hymedesmia sp. n. MRB-2018]|nr:MAG: ABC transporter ATP-binding protein [Methylococcales symbiont of Hymedesmia sp. n. MRB-2018]KAF3983082.1 MAG: ABC transporter ATP-binding protein [Methylococcales symbiont of Hymedesmia sp. n. MRB-2018]